MSRGKSAPAPCKATIGASIRSEARRFICEHTPSTARAPRGPSCTEDRSSSGHRDDSVSPRCWAKRRKSKACMTSLEEHVLPAGNGTHIFGADCSEANGVVGGDQEAASAAACGERGSSARRSGIATPKRWRDSCVLAKERSAKSAHGIAGMTGLRSSRTAASTRSCSNRCRSSLVRTARTSAGARMSTLVLFFHGGPCWYGVSPRSSSRESQWPVARSQKTRFDFEKQ
mmetsp:Transcript_38656/g.101974  ORF Transcript_38656/g.101974 Transcript_38656/m.101974 type:complete len:229 (+) Transcript_38656:966-1652(+)